MKYLQTLLKMDLRRSKERSSARFLPSSAVRFKPPRLQRDAKTFLRWIPLIVFMGCLFPFSTPGQNRSPERNQAQIVVGSKASEMERYAAKELRRYLYQVSGTFLEIRPDVKNITHPSFVIGLPESNPAIAKLLTTRKIEISPLNPGPQGYVLKKIETDGHTIIVIAGSDEVGCLYGVYGLLADYYGIGFFLGGDMLPDKKIPLTLVDVNEKKSPSMYIRGFLPWTNFPQSATSYSWEDW